jgi:hypothetical protein
MHLDRVAQTREMIGCGQTAWASANDQHSLAAWRSVDLERPAFFCGQVAQKSLYGVYANRTVQLLAIAVIFARVVANPPVYRGHGIVADERFPSVPMLSSLNQGKPLLNVLAGRAGMIAGWQEIDIERSARAHWSSAQLRDQVDDRRKV